MSKFQQIGTLLFQLFVIPPLNQNPNTGNLIWKCWPPSHLLIFSIISGKSLCINFLLYWCWSNMRHIVHCHLGKSAIYAFLINLTLLKYAIFMKEFCILKLIWGNFYHVCEEPWYCIQKYIQMILLLGHHTVPVTVSNLIKMCRK